MTMHVYTQASSTSMIDYIPSSFWVRWSICSRCGLYVPLPPFSWTRNDRFVNWQLITVLRNANQPWLQSLCILICKARHHRHTFLSGQLVGSLTWIGRHANPNLMQPVVYVAQLYTFHVRDHFLTLLCFLRCLNIVKDRKVMFRGGLSSRTPFILLWMTSSLHILSCYWSITTRIIWSTPKLHKHDEDRNSCTSFGGTWISTWSQNTLICVMTKLVTSLLKDASSWGMLVTI